MAHTHTPLSSHVNAQSYDDLLPRQDVQLNKRLARVAASEPHMVHPQPFESMETCDDTPSLSKTCLQSVQAYLHQAKDLWCCFSNTFSEKQNLYFFTKNEKNSTDYTNRNDQESEQVRTSTEDVTECRESGSSLNAPPIGFSFSPAGLLLPYHLGVLHCLNYFGIVNSSVPLAGASAGAIAVSAIACNVDVKIILQALFRAQSSLRATGAARKLHTSLEDQLNTTLPENAHLIINSRPGAITIAYATVWPYIKGHFPRQFESFSDLKECIIASCNIPFYFSNWPTVNCRGYAAVDGYFASTKNFGCPKTGAIRDIFVIPFSVVALHLPVPLRDCISPDIQQYDDFFYHPDNQVYLQIFQKYMEKLSFDDITTQPEPVADDPHYTTCHPDSKNSLFTSYEDFRKWIQFEAPNIAHKISEENVDSTSQTTSSLTPNALTSTLPVLKYSISMLFKIALDPVSDHIMLDIFNLGRADCYRWIVREMVHYGDTKFFNKDNIFQYL